MAPSLRDLIDFLLAEIALCGSQGASPADILTFIDIFYARSTKDGLNRNHVVDRRFQEKVWQWLTRNPEVSVGKNREWNYLTLEDAERREPETEFAGEGLQDAQIIESNTTPIRMFVSKERTWLAVTGHEPDETKVLPLEFALLSIIASRKSAGIVQPELIKISGQDKRSVPKRTDVLYQKGYIEKRAIQIKAARTSLCTLRQFFNPENLTAEKPAVKTSEAGTDETKIIDFRRFTENLFQILREYKIIARNDLKNLLGFNDRWRWKVLSRAVRKFERIGVLKRVRAMSQYAQTVKKHHPCVMLVRDPSDRDIEMFHEFSRNIYSDMEQDGNAEFDDDAEADDAARGTSTSENIGAVKREEDVEVSGRILPLWDPDRNMHNQLFDVIDRTGTIGSTNYDVIRACFGVFYRRPLEHTLARLVECWQLSQPPHLRHLALVRDTALQRTITHYIHYSARNFNTLVDAGEASWEAVEFIPRNGKSSNFPIPPVDAKPQFDTYGLPFDVPIKGLLNDGDSSLLECMLVVKPPNYYCSSSDPKAIKLQDGTYTVQYANKKPQPRMGQGVRYTAEIYDSLDTPMRSKTEDDATITSVGANKVGTSQRKPPRKAKQDSVTFHGMSKKERLEALGLDETWTEYSVLLINRPDPGVYVTPRGRRRPAGRRQGRPRISRLAVFKSPKLLALPWFDKECDDSDSVNLASKSPQPHEEDESLSAPFIRHSAEPGSAQKTGVTGGTRRSSKRRGPDIEFDSEPQRAPKFRRLNTERRSQGESTPEKVVRNGNASETHTDEPHHLSRDRGKRLKRKRSPAHETRQREDVHFEEEGARAPIPGIRNMSQEQTPGPSRNRGASSKRHRRASTDRSGTEASKASVLTTKDLALSSGLPKSSTGAGKGQEYPSDSLGVIKNSPCVLEDVTGSSDENTAALGCPPDKDSAISKAGSGIPERTSGDALTRCAPSMEISTPGATQSGLSAFSVSPTPEGLFAKARRSKLIDKGGSVAFLRRKIVMDIVEKAGGAFPMGTELWYAFMTAWVKSKYKERPDLRTIRTAAKHLVDAGRLRQQTFCGKDNKGIMVTKTIVCKSDLGADDPIIKDMQEKMLASGTQYYFPPNVEVSPGLSKQGPTKKNRQLTDIPFESGLTVQLHQKPAAVAAIEKRKGQSIQRKLQRRLEIENMQKTRPSGVIRLLSIQRPEANMPSIHNMTSMFMHRQAQARDEVEKHGGTGRLKRLCIPISLMAPYAMFMNPKQSFNPNNGTFSTNAGLAALHLARTPPPSHRRRTSKQIPHLPESLDDLFTQTRRRDVNLSGETDLRSKKFFRDNEAILRWELQNEELLQHRSENLRYINQTIEDSFESVPIDRGIRFKSRGAVKNLVSSSRTTTTRKQTRLSPAVEHPLVTPVPGLDARFESESPPPINTVTPSYYKSPAVPQLRRLEKLNEFVATAGNDNAMPAANRQPLRRNRLVSQLPRSVYQRLMTAIVVVRALAGGLDGKTVDWALVSHCFPDQDPKFIQDKGKGILGRNRLQIVKMQSDFQGRFIEAYANNEVPSINYDDLEGYDWDAVIEWANTQLDVPKSEKIPDLPATKSQFDDIFEIREEPLGSLDEVYQGQSVTVNRKRTLISSVAFASTLLPKPATYRSQRHLQLSRLDTVKSWVRANILTPEEVYRPADAKDALAYIDGGFLGSAIQSLVTERVISQSNRGRVIPGRNYDITDHFQATLSKRRPIEIAELRRAARFKTNVLDAALTRERVYNLQYNAEDGEILALINLFAEGRIDIKPRDPPRDKFGLTEGGYLTRLINKEKLRFPVDILPVQNLYTTGNPIYEKSSTIPPPCPPLVAISGTVSVPEKIPLWHDIHGGFIQVLWDLAVAAVLGSVATRPGITAAGIAGMIKPTMGAWEVNMLLGWLVEAGVMRRSGGDDESKEPGWAVAEWWWMVLN